MTLEEKEIIVYFMYDNHTFSRLSTDFSKAVDEVNTIIEQGNTYGSISASEYKKMIHLRADKELADKNYLNMLNMYKDLGLV